MQPNENPCGLDGFAFLEFSGPDRAHLDRQFREMGFTETARLKTRDISLWSQGHIRFIVNNEKSGQAHAHANLHGSGACAMGFRVKNAKAAHAHALANGAVNFDSGAHGLYAIEAIGGSVIYFAEGDTLPFAGEWNRIAQDPAESDCGLQHIDHLTHNVFRGNMDKWAGFYEKLFNFREIRFFNIRGQMTGLLSRAMASPCGSIKIPLNESKDNQSQIEEFLHEYHGEGIQHIALTTENIYRSVQSLRDNNVRFLDVPDTYYEMLETRIPWHREPLDALAAGKILMDGEQTEDAGLLLQIFTENLFGPVFFEIIQRKGNQGFGEGNFQALFEAIERDQVRRGTLKPASKEHSA